MGLVYENIILKNAGDVTVVQRGLMNNADVRQTEVRAMVDTGADTLVINEAIRQELGLALRGEKQVSLANEATETCGFTEPVEVHWNDRFTFVPALVLPGAEEVLLGAIALEGLNVIVDPTNQRLAGAHGDEVIYKIK